MMRNLLAISVGVAVAIVSVPGANEAIAGTSLTCSSGPSVLPRNPLQITYSAVGIERGTKITARALVSRSVSFQGGLPDLKAGAHTHGVVLNCSEPGSATLVLMLEGAGLAARCTYAVKCGRKHATSISAPEIELDTSPHSTFARK